MSKPKTIRKFVVLLAAVALLGYGFSAVSAWISIKSEVNYTSFCMTSTCVGQWLDMVERPLQVAKATSDFLVALATVGGIVVALLTYFSSVNNSALANHITHYTTFQTYIISEIAKRSRINASSIDIFYWYNSIFAQSRSGNMIVSEGYLKYIVELGALIGHSNRLVASASTEMFRFKPHQERIIGKFKEIGVEISLQPRLEFYEIEDQLFSLVSSINQAFCSTSKPIQLPKRSYL
jgi:hypothetical protein